MTIVLNEYDWAKGMIDQGSLGDSPFETLCRVAKYYMTNGYRGKDLKILLSSFLSKCDPFVSVPKWDNTLNVAISRAQKYSIVMIDEIIITKSEIEKIRSLNAKQTERLAFTLLCLSKYYDHVNPNADHWVNTPDGDIMRMANIRTSVRRQSAMYHAMNQLGLIQFSKKVDNINVRVCFANDDDECAIRVTDMRNLGYQYMLGIGEQGYMVCQNCGVTSRHNIKATGRRPKYCDSCAAEIKIRQNVESVMTRRSAKK